MEAPSKNGMLPQMYPSTVSLSLGTPKRAPQIVGLRGRPVTVIGSLPAPHALILHRRNVDKDSISSWRVGVAGSLIVSTTGPCPFQNKALGSFPKLGDPNIDPNIL